MVTCRRLEVLSFSVIANVLTLWLLSLLPASANSAESVVFPVVSGDVSVKEKYGAKDDGKTDDTAAFQMAMAMADGVRNLYLPAGRYLLSDSIVVGGKRCQWQGENEATTVLKLQDRAAGFDNVEQPKPFVSTFAAFRDPKAAMGQAFRNSLFNLTIDVGAGNPGAVALHDINNNQGTVRDVMPRSSVPQRVGKAGLALVTNWPGPAYIHRITIDGFDIGLWSANSQFSFVCEHLRLSGQSVVGIENIAQMLSIRKLVSSNLVPVLRTRGNAGFLMLLDAELNGGDSKAYAIEAVENSTLIVERLKTSGYGTAIRATSHGKTREINASVVNDPVLPLNPNASVAPVARLKRLPS